MIHFFKLFRSTESKKALPGIWKGEVSVLKGFLYFIFLLLFLSNNRVNAQLTFNNGLTAQAIAQMLAGPGVTISNATLNCAASGIGSFSGTSSIGFTSGILLTTGSTAVASPNTSSSSAGACNNTPGDPQLNSLAGATTYDACALEFDIIPLCDTLTFKYVFGSEEYPEYVNSGYNDAFAFYVSGPGITGQPNIAKLPGTSTFVTIDNVNSGANSQYYVANSGSSIEYDGYTSGLTAWTLVQPCQTYHVKIVIADAGDCVFDSGVFLEAGSLQCATVVSAQATIQNAIEGCQDGSIEFCRPAPATSPVTINFTIAGTAINGTDYTTITTSVTIPAGQLCATIPIVPIADGVTEANETVKIIYQPGPCPMMDTITIVLSDSSPLNAGPDTTFCTGGSATIGIPALSGVTYSWSPATGLSSSTSSNPTVTLTNGGTGPLTTNYVLTATAGVCVSTDTVAATVTPPSSADAGIDQTVCSLTAVLSGVISGAATMGTWSGGTGTFNPNNNSLNGTYTFSTAELSAGTATLTLTTDDPPGACLAASDQITFTISTPTSVSAGNDQTICIGNTVTLAGSIVGISTSGIWSGGTGTYNPDNTSPTAVYTPSAAEGNSGTVTLTYSPDGPSGACASANDQMIITINPIPTANAGSGEYVCLGSDITLSGSIGGSATSGTWSGGTGTYSPNNTTLNAVYTPSAAEYAADLVELTLTTNDPIGPCTFSTSNVTFHFYENPVVNFTAGDSAGCPVHCTDFTNSSTIGGGASIVSLNWDFGDDGPASSEQNPFRCFSESGFYDITLTATSNNGCASLLTQTHLIEVYNLPVAEFTSSPTPATLLDPTILFNDQSSSDVIYWNWSFGDGDTLAPGVPSPVHNYPGIATGSYPVTLIVRNVDGCYDTVMHQIVIGPAFTFYIPNAFTPGGNGTNDYFFGSGIGIVKYDLLIFDRWGDMVFHGKELSAKWDGKANSGANLAQTDVYIWKVEITDVLNKKHSYIGSVTLVR